MSPPLLLWKPLPEAERLDAYYHHRAILMSSDNDDDRSSVKLFTKRQVEDDQKILISAASLSEIARQKQRPATATQRQKEHSKKERPRSAPGRISNKAPVRVYPGVDVDEERGAPDVPTLSICAKPKQVVGFNNLIISDLVEDLQGRTIQFTGTLTVSLFCATPWATVRYQTDDDDVWRLCRGSIEISADTELKARSSKRGWYSDEIRAKFVKRVDSAGVKERIRRASTLLAMKHHHHRNSSFSLGRTPRERERESLLFAIRDRNVIVVRKLLKAGVENPKDDTALVEACNGGLVIIVSLLLSHGVEPSTEALCAACRANSPRCCRLLIQKGVCIESPKLSPLHVACQVGAARCVDVLLKAGADVDRPSPRDGDDDLPLHATCRNATERNENDFATCVRLLVDAGAHLEAKVKNRRPIQLAHRSHAPNLVQCLLDAGAKPLILKQPNKRKTAARTKR